MFFNIEIQNYVRVLTEADFPPEQIVGRIGIENRPIEVEEKQRFGDLEIDLVIGKDHK